MAERSTDYHTAPHSFFITTTPLKASIECKMIYDLMYTSIFSVTAIFNHMGFLSLNFLTHLWDVIPIAVT
jgi:hypothetical protein